VSAPAAVPPPSSLPAKAPPAPIAVGARGVELRTLDEMFRFAQAVVQAGLAPRGMDTPQKVLVAIQWGAELGLSPMQSVQGLPIVNGRPRPEVAVALALVMGSGLLEQRHERWEGEGDQRRCVAALVRRGGMAVERSFSLAEAKRAGLTSKDNWKHFPDRMLYARAMGHALNDLFPDVLRGVAPAGSEDFIYDVDPAPLADRLPPRRPAEQGPDPLLARLEAENATHPISQAIELELQDEREPAPIEETDDDGRDDTDAQTEDEA